MTRRKNMRYKDAGVNIDAGAESVQRIKKLVRSTFTKNVLTDIGGFGALFDGSLKGYREPVLVSSCDGVGTKLKIALMANKHDTVGQDLVNHCINDILVQGARPLFFMDYAAFGRLDPRVMEQVVKGFAKACKENGCSLIGGETAEMPGMYAIGDYDLAGFIVGVVEKKKLITGRNIKPGDVVIGLSTNGLQTNGYSLARKILFEKCRYQTNTYLPEIKSPVGDALLKVHPSFLGPVSPLMDKGLIKGMAHITGGGFLDNIPRVLPEKCGVEISLGSWPVLPIFDLLQKKGNVPQDDMYRTFNMGIGFVLIVAERDANETLKMLKKFKTFKPYVIGRVVKGNRIVKLLPKE
ncbi:MAG: phosphoribosylformylglycinamidine cyclo-ligase [Candidatus Edwardsbacteria bacterium]|nr:phosphoribosylformylglycinamidine cyclo-ligase [Candidatus Edwardsbacteria bacterium]MBU1576261.1 phosphoribosylformylglycinamidine cyclo-ligase [Candidatus Edwardsbacteria bacterium]MBU2462660.1 phosphoribosylformylglycinamidine cyclo-ligase [Candidatus Edwardsbacteria bacterium]MBU2594443.1 phosphoribosylformylglycinamidine cyclo-ligase [Candidatus Edwardsbacteria bacterium]